MSSRLARSSQNSSQRRLRRLNFRPLVETRLQEDQVTMKVPASTPSYSARRGDFLAAPKLSSLENGSSEELSPASPEQQETLPQTSCYGLKRDVSLLDTRETPKLGVSLLDIRKSLAQDLASLDKLTPLPAEPENSNNASAVDEGAEFVQRGTIPMMVLTSITTRQGKPQTEMKSEVSGAAGAAGLVGMGSIVGSVLKYVTTFFIQYGFGAGGYGLYTLSLSLINLVAAVFNLGLDDAMVRYVAIYRGKQQIKSLRGLLLFCTTLAGIAGLVGALLLLFFTPTLVTFWIGLKQHHLANKDTLTRAIALLQVMAPIIPLMTMQIMWYAGLRGFKAFKWRVLTASILQPLLQIILMVFVLAFFHDRDGIAAVAVVLFLSTMVSTVLNMYFLFRQVAKVATPEPEQYEVREWLTFASLNFLTTIIDTVLDSIDTILLAAFGVSDVALGQYGAAIRLSTFIAMPLLSLNNIFAPTIAELHSKGELQKLESMFKVVTKWSITFSLPIFLVTVIFSPYLLALPGASFIPAWPLLIAFALGSMINAGTGSVGYMLLMTGYQRLSFLNSVVAVAVNLVLGILLTPRYGAMGTAISTGLAICALNFMRVLQVRLLLKMHPYRKDMLKPVAAGAISAVLVGIPLLLLNIGHVHTAIHLRHAIVYAQLLLIPMFLASYIALIIFFKGSPEDEIVLKALSKKFLRGGKNKQKKQLKEA